MLAQDKSLSGSLSLGLTSWDEGDGAKITVAGAEVRERKGSRVEWSGVDCRLSVARADFLDDPGPGLGS